MSEPREGPIDVTEDRPLIELVAATVLAVPGVRRLEPSLAGGLNRLVRPGGAADGLAIVRVGTRLEVTVDIAVAESRPALLTASEVEAAIYRLVDDDAGRRAAVTVRVLAVEL